MTDLLYRIKRMKFNKPKIKEYPIGICQLCGKEFVKKGRGSGTRKYCLDCGWKLTDERN